MLPTADEYDRLEALTDILCAAAAVDQYIAEQEIAAVLGVLQKFFGAAPIPQELMDRISLYDPAQFDLDAALDRLALADDADEKAMLGFAVEVVQADRFIDSSEYGFVADLAQRLGQAVPERFR